MSFLKTIIGANALVMAFGFAFIADANAQYSGSGYRNNVYSQQRATLQSKIDFALKSGQISSAQATSLQAMISTNLDAETQAMLDGSLSFTERKDLSAGLDAVETGLNSLIAHNLSTSARPSDFNRPFDRGDWGSRRTRNADEVNSLRSAAEAKVSTSLASNQITSAQASSVRAILSNNATQQASFMVDGRIDSREKEELTKGIQAAHASLDSLIKINISNNANGAFNFYDKNWWNRNWNSGLNSSMVARLSKLSERIERGKIRGRLTASEYTSLKAELDRLSTPNQFGFRGRHSRWNKASFETAVNNLELRVRTELTDSENANRRSYF
ncbi:MAG: hypothetical protein K2X77_21905 [Candidatus Obscuribacterales bacterium]|nr:hypothetical protein [Candidatus Obscuribacterales bacterium]